MQTIAVLPAAPAVSPAPAPCSAPVAEPPTATTAVRTRQKCKNAAAKQRQKRADRCRRQEHARRQEAHRRRTIAALASTRTQRRIRATELAGLFATSPRSLCRWQQIADDPDAWLPLGRPPKQASDQVRNALFSYLSQHGSRVGVPKLRAQFPQVGKREMEEYVRRVKRVERHRHGKFLHRLTWLKPGATWTLDFSEPAAALEHPYQWLLCVRDLGSGRTLLWQAVEHDDSATVVAILAGLFARYGAPLVLKSDNGPHFRGEVPAFLEQHGVIQLYSPAYTPAYNGACEAGQGSLKTRAHEFACRAGHPDLWTCDILEAARLQANETQVAKHPAGADGNLTVAVATPPLYHYELPWAPIPDSERAAVARTVAQEELKLRKEMTDTTPDESKKLDAATIKRLAISRACVACGLLTIRRKRVNTPF